MLSHTHTYTHSGSVIRQGSMKEVTDGSWTGDKGAFNLKLVCATQFVQVVTFVLCLCFRVWIRGTFWPLSGRLTVKVRNQPQIWPICSVFTTLRPSFYSTSVLCGSLSLSNKTFLSALLFQRRSCTRTTRRRPCIMTRMRTPIPENPNQITASWCSTDPFAPPGASSAWSDIDLTSFSPSLHTVYTQCCACAVLECECSEECCHIQFGPGPYPSSHYFYPSLCLSGSMGAFLLRTRVGREEDSQADPQEVLEALLGQVPARWQTPRTRQTANMLKMLPQRRSAVAVHCII